MGKYMIRAAAGLALLTVVCAGAGCAGPSKQEKDKGTLRIGVLLYREDDTFIGTLKEALEKQARSYEQDSGVKVTMDILDAKGSQNTQANQADRLISLDCDALCVNIVDRFASSVVIDKAMAADTPVVFFNREPVEEDLGAVGKAVLCRGRCKGNGGAPGADPGGRLSGRSIFSGPQRRREGQLCALGGGNKPSGFPDPHRVVH